MTAVDDPLVCAPGGPVVGIWPVSAPRDPLLTRLPTSTTRVLVVGYDPDRVRWALTQVWRRAGRPLVVTCSDRTPAGRGATWWVAEHQLAGVRRVAIDDPTAGRAVDVIVVCGWFAALRLALPVARQAGIDVVDAATVPEFR